MLIARAVSCSDFRLTSAFAHSRTGRPAPLSVRAAQGARAIVGNAQVVDVEGAGAGPSGVDKTAEQQPEETVTVKSEPPAAPGGQFQNCVSEA